MTEQDQQPGQPSDVPLFASPSTRPLPGPSAGSTAQGAQGQSAPGQDAPGQGGPPEQPRAPRSFVHAPGSSTPAVGLGAEQGPSSYPPGFPPQQPLSTPLSATSAPQVRVRRAPRALSVGWVVPLVVLALVAGLVGGVLGARWSADDHLADAGLPAIPSSAPRPSGGAAAGTAEASVAQIAATVLPSVVSIESTGGDGTATGSGFVLRADGYLLTNNHVVAGAVGGGSLTVTFSDGHERRATIVGRTSDYDLAVIKVDEKGLTPLVLGRSADVVVGDPVVAIGAPLGLAGTVTTGIVSALNRPVSAGDSADTAFINAIQTDAAINPGNSGGPLVDAEGEVIGINSAIAQPPGTNGTTGGSIGLGFAIPSDQARRTAEQLIEKGHATYPIIGVLLDQAYVGEGVKVASKSQQGTPPVTPDGPADRAGIRSGDVILSIDDRPVTQPDELIVAIRAHTPGDTVALRVRTGPDERTVRVVLDESGS
ncbi:S1C family serine protease [Cellulomonas sp. HZM]|uniref:S1C family serine protease n=1 Tax=Cellulomonas sp. HZM TaxID=1454010 RepID=UPI000556299F|nr:trypsin-like peptidase domain-containing protein [Cellulomonas sp. HZM]